MLLNELQKQARADQKRDWEQQRVVSQVEQQARQLALKNAQIAALQGQLTAVNKTNLAIDARLEALERQARASKPERLVAAMR
jgi:prefoldin subunit 5